MNRQIFSLVMLTALLAAVITSCKKNTPAWQTDAAQKFANGRFVPEMQDIVPSSMLGSATSNKAGASAASGVSTRSFDPTNYETLPFSDIKGAYTDGSGIKSLLSGISNWRLIMLDIKNDVLDNFERRKLTNQNVWVDGVKYEEINGDKFIYWKGRADATRESAGAKLSMHSDGANEIYFFEKRVESDQMRRSYSYLKGDKFIFVCVEPDGFWFLSSDTENGKKKGKYFSVFNDGENVNKGYEINVFEGNANDFVSHTSQYQTVFQYQVQRAFSTINGIVCPYNYHEIDLRAFANVEEIYYQKVDFDYLVQGLKLTDGSIIDWRNEWWRRLYMQEAYEVGKNNLDHWDLFPTDGFSILLLLDFSEEPATLSGAIPAELSQLQLSAGFEELYADLKSKSAVFFNNFYITEFQPIAGIQLNNANVQPIINAVNNYLQTHHEEF